MKRDIKQFQNTLFDVLVIGAGVHGAAIAWDAALRGYRVALIEKDDFGSQTSANNLKIAHGGLRYLQQLDWERMRQSIRERSILMRVAPHLVHPLPCLMPTRGRAFKGREALTVALKLNDWVGFDRNRLSGPSKLLPNGKILSKEQAESFLPGLDHSDVTGAALWYDALMHNADRLTFSFVKSAHRAGAAVANYLSANRLLTDRKKIVGVEALDHVSGKKVTIKSRLVVNAAGPWSDEILASHPTLKKRKKQGLTKAFNLIVRKRLVKTQAAGVYRPGGQVLFMVPWQNHTLIGTAHVPLKGKTKDPHVQPEERDDFIRQFNEAYPGEPIAASDVVHVLSGLLPGSVRAPGEIDLQKKFQIIDHEREDKWKGLLTVVAVKYTTARGVAEKVVDEVGLHLELRKRLCRTDTTPLVGGNIKDFRDFLEAQLDIWKNHVQKDIIRHLVFTYGTTWREVVEQTADIPDRFSRFSAESYVTESEIRYAVEKEMVVHLSDVVLRRTPLGAAGHPGTEALERCSHLVADLLHWTDAQRQEELSHCERFFELHQSKPPLESVES